VNPPSPVLNNWFVCPQANPNTETRLFIFPYAGGSPAAFWKWAAEFPDYLETWIAHYPGRGSRFNEAPIKQLNILVEKLGQAIEPQLEKPFVFFGHSLGGLVAFELAYYLHQNHLQQPKVLFAAGCRAPHQPATSLYIHTLPDSEFLQALRDLNGTPIEILENSELIELLRPTLRADFELAETYQFVFNRPPLSCPIVAFGGLNDQQLSQEHLQGWARHTNTDFRLQYFPGDHFFINEMEDAVIVSITEEIMNSSAKESR